MVWVGMCSRVKIRLLFIGWKSKVNTHYYVDKMLKPFLKKDLLRLFPGGEKNMILHQDSAPSHTTIYTLKLLKDRGVNLITPEE